MVRPHRLCAGYPVAFEPNFTKRDLTENDHVLIPPPRRPGDARIDQVLPLGPRRPDDRLGIGWLDTCWCVYFGSWTAEIRERLITFGHKRSRDA